MPKVIVIGAGAAGLIAAGAAAEAGANVVVLERNNVAGRKLAITGKGRCNVTNTADKDEFMKNLPGNGQFLFSCLNRFTPQDSISLFENLGVELKVERGGRVFPTSDDAHQVVDALVRYAQDNGVHIRFGCRVTSLVKTEEQFIAQVTNEPSETGDKVVIATGGASYPGTGSTGDGYKLGAAFGHTIIKPSPALVPLESPADWIKDVQGLSLHNIEASLVLEGRILQAEFGEMLFTHFGVSGPVILTLSRWVTEEVRKGKTLEGLSLVIDLKPALSVEQLDERVKRDFAIVSRKMFKNSLDALLPKKLIAPIITLSKIDGDKPVNQISREERHSLVSLLKSLTVPISGTRPLNEAIITAGGISVKEINPKTMESKLIQGLFFAGEVLDVDGYTGGYNLQAAWSTAHAAGLAAGGLH